MSLVGIGASGREDGACGRGCKKRKRRGFKKREMRGGKEKEGEKFNDICYIM
jgi:hypothetical protein